MKQKLKIEGQIYEVSESLWNKIKQMKENNLGEVRLNNKTFKLSSIEVIDANIVDNLNDWSALDKTNYKEYKDIPEEVKVVSNEKANENREIIKSKIKKMLKERNKDWKPVYKDPIHKEAVSDIWEHLKSSIKTLEFPQIDFSWKDDSSITQHTEGTKTHSVAYKTKVIDLGDKYDYHFWAEANYIFCKDCNKHIRKQIVIFNDYESECVVREL